MGDPSRNSPVTTIARIALLRSAGACDVNQQVPQAEVQLHRGHRLPYHVKFPYSTRTTSRIGRNQFICFFVDRRITERRPIVVTCVVDHDLQNRQQQPFEDVA